MKRGVTGFFMAWGMFCTIPCPYKRWDEACRKQMLVFLPLIGLLIGAVWYLLYLLLTAVHFPAPLLAAVMTLAPFLLSGAMHLDGYMDCCDAILSRRPQEERLRILKDSHVGAFAVICVCGLLVCVYGGMLTALGGWSGYFSAGMVQTAPVLIGIPVVSRAMSALQVLCCPAIGHSQYAASTSSAEGRKASCIILCGELAAAFVSVCTLCAIGGSGQGTAATAGGVILAVCAAVHYITCAYGRRQLGGMSGDISGLGIVVSEAAAVIGIALL